MKKNIMMRLSALLLVAVLLTTCVISGTFAKYVTSEQASDKATVAKWGIALSVEGENVLYDDDKTTNDVAVKVLTTELAAPGTYQKLATVTLEGKPEVAYEIKVVAELELDKWTVTEGEYCPLVFTVDGTAIKMDGNNIKTVDELEAAVEEAIKLAIAGDETGVKEYAPNESVPATANEVVVDWMWAFEGNDDANDTELGNADTKATIDFKLTVTVTQID